MLESNNYGRNRSYETDALCKAVEVLSVDLITIELKREQEFAQRKGCFGCVAIGLWDSEEPDISAVRVV